MITTVSCGLLLLLTCLLVHLSTCLLEQFIFTKQIRERIEINLKQVISAPL